MSDVADALRETMQVGVLKQLGVETDRAALDEVKPKGQDPKSSADPKNGEQPTGDTDDASEDPGEKQPPKHTEQELDKARKALRLQGHDEEDLAVLTDDQLVALGKKAAARNAAKSREMREKAEARKATAKPEPVKGDGGDDEEIAEYEGLARQHFADFQDDGSFSRSLAGFARAVGARSQAAQAAALEAMKESLAEEMGSHIAHLKDAMHFELGARALASRYPQAATKEGRKALVERYAKFRSGEGALDPHEAIEAAGDSLWAGAQLKADAERQAKLKAARQGGHSAVASQGEAPKQKGTMDVVREAVRQHLSG